MWFWKRSSPPAHVQKQGEQLESIFGADDRRIVDDIEHPFWRPFCLLKFSFPGKDETFIGTGVLIGPRLILTAAHNLYSLDARAGVSAATAMAGFRDGQPSAEAAITSWRIHSDYPNQRPDDPNRYRYDFGVALVDSDALFQWAGAAWSIGAMTPFPDGALAKKRLLIAGYPAAGQLQDSCLKWSYGSPLSGQVSNTLFTYRIDTTGGQSGAPVFHLETETSPPVIAGIHVSGFEGEHNIARRFTPAAKKSIEGWCQQLGGPGV